MSHKPIQFGNHISSTQVSRHCILYVDTCDNDNDNDNVNDSDNDNHNDNHKEK